MVLAGGDLAARQRAGRRKTAEVAVSSDAVEGALLHHDTRIDVELTLLVDATHDVANHRAGEGQTLLEAALKGLVEHNGLQGVNGHQLEVGG